jgi:hypothetical protein
MQLEGLVIPVSFNTALLSKGVDIITDLIGDAVSATFEWADGMDALGDATGMTSDQTAAWSFVAKKAGVDVGTLANSTVILQKGLFDSEGQLSSTGKALEDFGVSLYDANGNVKDQNSLLKDIGDRYAKFGTQTERIDFLTNIFGKSGANLVDVFDTLATEGGIDSVTDKVKSLGLAIDSDRYEQFNRSLEELKLAGTGLAVQLTEALMPAFESVLQWAQQFAGMTPEQIFMRMTDIISALPEKFSEWAKSVNWEQVSSDLIDGINGVDWNGIGVWVGESAQFIADGLVTIFSGIDWAGVFGSIGTAFMEFSTGLVGGNFEQFKAVWSSNWTQAGQIVTQMVNIAKTSVTNWLQSIPSAISNYFSQAFSNLASWVGRMLDTLSSLTFGILSVPQMQSSFVSSGTRPPGRASGGSANGLTWVGERGPELVNLPGGSYVNNNQSSASMGIDYYKLASILAVEFAKVRD